MTAEQDTVPLHAATAIDHLQHVVRHILQIPSVLVLSWPSGMADA